MNGLISIALQAAISSLLKSAKVPKEIELSVFPLLDKLITDILTKGVFAAKLKIIERGYIKEAREFEGLYDDWKKASTGGEKRHIEKQLLRSADRVLRL